VQSRRPRRRRHLRAEYRGIVQYYLLASDVWRLGRLRWAAATSMLKTLAAKHNSTVSAIATKYKTVVETPHGKRTCFQARLDRDGRASPTPGHS
jgi:hypothetical protein